MPDLAKFFEELKRRRVFRVLTVYCVFAWVAVEVTSTVAPELGLPAWTPTLVILLVALGFPFAAVLAWAFDLTPDGVKRTSTSPPGAHPRRRAETPGRRALPTAKRPREVVATPDAGQARLATLATLRHELRTPLNAVLGYSEMLLEDVRPDAAPERTAELRQIHDLGKRLLARIDELLRPDAAADELGESEMAAIRARAQTVLPEPVRGLVDASATALETARAADDQASLPDLQRISAAAMRLSEQVDGLAVVAAVASGKKRELTVAERVMGRIRLAAGDAPVRPRHGQLLVVDDNAMNRDLLSRQLARQGYSVAVASNGPEALEMLHARNFDLVLLDVLMPEMDGIQVLDLMQQDPALAELPVIMISALDEIEGVVRCIERGAVDYLSKPFDPVLLQARIGTTLEVRRLRESERRTAESLGAEVAWAERLARSFLPARVAEQAHEGTTRFSRFYPDVTVLAAEIDGFGTLALRSGPERALEKLSAVVERFDRAAAEFQIETLWTGGRSFVAIAGTDQGAEDPADTAALFALRLAEEIGELDDADPLRIGLGLHTGALTTVLTGDGRLMFGLWGDAVDVAQGLGRAGTAGHVTASSASYARLFESFDFEDGGVLEVDHRIQTRVYRLLHRKRVISSRRGSGH